MKTILVVDDEPDILLVLEILFATEGYRVVSASNGTEALARFETERPDVVLADIMMPDIDGLELSRRIRAAAYSPAVPVILMSAGVDSFGQTLTPPARFISKPLDFDRLLDLVREVTGEG